MLIEKRLLYFDDSFEIEENTVLHGVQLYYVARFPSWQNSLTLQFVLRNVADNNSAIEMQEVSSKIEY